MRQGRDQLLRRGPADGIINQGRRDRHRNGRRVRTGRLRHRREQQTREIADVRCRCRDHTCQARDADTGEHRPAVRLQQDIIKIKLPVGEPGGMRRGQRLSQW